MRIDPIQHGWMTAPETLAVMAALGEGRFVGGAVRNALLGVPVVDIDIAVPMPPEEATARLKAKGIKVVETGLEHGTVTAVAGTHAFEVTSLRKDVETDGRHAVVAFTDDWAEDAARRDFTINALYASAEGEIFDYATGVEDLIAGRVRFMGDARTRIAEDYLRVLRLFRFHAWYGKGDLDSDALRAAAEAKGKLKTLSAERIAKELLKTLAARDPRAALALMARIGVLAQVLPEALETHRFESLVEIELGQFWAADAELRLAAMTPDAATASTMAKRLRLSNAQHDRLVAALGEDPAITSGMSPKAARRAVYVAGPQAFADRVKLAWAASNDTAAANQWLALLTIGQSWRAPSLPVTGEDAAALGLARGPKVGEALREVEAWWIDQDFPDDRRTALEQLKAVARRLA